MINHSEFIHMYCNCHKLLQLWNYSNSFTLIYSNRTVAKFWYLPLKCSISHILFFRWVCVFIPTGGQVSLQICRTTFSPSRSHPGDPEGVYWHRSGRSMVLWINILVLWKMVTYGELQFLYTIVGFTYTPLIFVNIIIILAVNYYRRLAITSVNYRIQWITEFSELQNSVNYRIQWITKSLNANDTPGVSLGAGLSILL